MSQESLVEDTLIPEESSEALAEATGTTPEATEQGTADPLAGEVTVGGE